MPLAKTQLENVFETEKGDFITSKILNLNTLDEANEKQIANTITTLVSKKHTLVIGLDYLNAVLGSCSKNCLLENAFTWLSLCLQKQDKNELCHEYKLQTVGNIMEILPCASELNKKIVSELLPKIVDNCLHVNYNKFNAHHALSCLTVCLKLYPAWFGSQTAKIENFLTSFLNTNASNCNRSVEQAAIAFLYLQQTGGAGAGGINHINNFTTQFHKLCDSIHPLFDVMFVNITEIDKVDQNNEDIFSFKKCNDWEPQVAALSNCLKFLAVMMQKPFPVPKFIKPEKLLAIINRGLNVHVCVSPENLNVSWYTFSIHLCNIQRQLVKLLRIFILWYQTNALPFSYTISRLLLDCLKRSQACDCFKADSFQQEIIYKTLNYWIRLAKNSLHSIFQNQLMSYILKDTTYVKKQVTLTMTVGKSAQEKRKAIQKRMLTSGANNSDVEDTRTSLMSNQKNNCKFALATLVQLLKSTTLRVSHQILVDLYATILKTVADVQASKAVYPYTDPECQVVLYIVLVAFYEQDSYIKILPPLQDTLLILNQGLKSTNHRVVAICEEGLSSLEKLCQPICPSLYLGSQTENIEESEPISLMPEVTTEQISLSVSYDEEVDDDDGEDDKTMEVVQEPKSREPNNHIKIIDMQIIKHSVDDYVEEKEFSSEEAVESFEAEKPRILRVKSEHISDVCDDDHNNSNENGHERENSDEPPIKKSKSEDEFYNDPDNSTSQKEDKENDVIVLDEDESDSFEFLPVAKF